MLRNKIDKPLIYIYLKNSAALLLFVISKWLLKAKVRSNSENLLFINTGQIGDLVITTSLFLNENALPYDKIYLLIKKEYLDLFACYKGRVELIVWDKKKYRYSFLYRYRFIKLLRNLKLKTAVNLTTARGPLNDELAIFSGADYKYCLNNDYKYLKRIFGKYYDGHYQKILESGGKSEYECLHLALSYLLGQKAAEGIHYAVDEVKLLQAKNLINTYSENGDKKVIVVNPFSDLDVKNWPSGRYIELFRLFENNKYLVFCQGSSRQRGRIDKLILGLKSVYNISGMLTLSQSAALIKLADLYIGNDSGFTHIAKALGVNTIAIIGGGSYGSFFPYLAQQKEYLLFKDVDCKGCEWRCTQERRICIEDVTVEQVYNLAQDLLGAMK